VPENWSYLPLCQITRDETCSGYLRFFDPDIVVCCGEIDKATIAASGRSIITANDITDPIADRGLLGYGLGLHEILAGLAQEEFKFTRRDNLKVLAPTITEPDNHFLTSDDLQSGDHPLTSVCRFAEQRDAPHASRRKYSRCKSCKNSR
jgi:hypothetical protein